VTGNPETTELLDVQMEQIAGVFVLITPWGLFRFECRETVETSSGKDSAHRRPTGPDRLGDALHGPAPVPKLDDPILGLTRSLARTAQRARGAVMQALLAVCLEPLDPSTDRTGINPEGPGGGTDRPAEHEHAMDEAGSTSRGQTGIVVNVHGDSFEDTASANSASFGGSPWTTY
jgi:hypothetical protein